MPTRIETLRDAVNLKVERYNQLRAGLAEYATRDEAPTDEERAQFAADIAEFDQLSPAIDAERSELARLEQVANAPARAYEAPMVMVRRDNPLVDESVQYGTVEQVRGAARTAIERLSHADDTVRQGLTLVMERADDASGKLARHLIAASRDTYRSAFSKLISGREWSLNDDERRAVEHVRAASLTDASGGYMVPTVLDPTLYVTGTHNGLSSNPYRDVCNVVTTTADNYNAMTSAGITAAWATEATEATDNAPTIAQTLLTPRKAHQFVPFSVEIQGDWPSVEAELRRLMQIAKDDLEIAAFTTGTGTTRPLGLMYDMYTNYTAQTQASATADTFAVADVYAVANKVANRYRGRGTFLANQIIYDKVRQFDTGGGGSLWVQLTMDQPATLLGRPAIPVAEIDGTYGSGENYVMAFGDLRAGYTICDRVGMSVELIPHVFGGSNNLPTGQRGLYAWWRVDARIIDSGAIGILNVT